MKAYVRLSLRLLVAGLFLFLSACGTPDDPTVNIDQTGLEDVSIGGQIDEWGTDVDPLGDPTAFPSNPVDTSAYAPVYFAFDSYTVAPSEVSKINSIASALTSNPSYAILLEGHTDERGSREYNLALGERRALAVRELLLSMGVANDRVQTLSLGEESPAVMGSDESAWSLNRRVQFQLMQ